MIRVLIIADTLPRARRLGELIEGDERLHVIDVRAATELEPLPFAPADVILAASAELTQLRTGGPGVVVLSEELPETAVFAESVRAWLPAHSSPEEIIAALIAAASGLSVLTGGQVKEWITHEKSELDLESSYMETLTPRELEVLRMLADGLANKQVALQLGISEHTAKFHVSQILAKLGAGTRTEAVTIGIRRGLVPV